MAGLLLPQNLPMESQRNRMANRTPHLAVTAMEQQRQWEMEMASRLGGSPRSSNRVAMEWWLKWQRK